MTESTQPLLDVRNLSKTFPGAHGRTVRALNGVSLTLAPGEVLGVVGESGCGKSTLGRSILRLIEPDSGSVVFDGDDLLALTPAAMKRRRRDVQIVFQDPFGSLNPRHKVGAIVREPLDVHKVGTSANRTAKVAALLETVGLSADAVGKYPHEFSGGQRQRIAIARALALDPKLIIADEPVSALDVSIQSQIINLIADLRKRLGLSILFISHDLSVIRHVSDRIAVMYLGGIVEMGPAADIMANPAHPYTEALLSAVPRPDAGRRQDRIVLKGDLPDPANPPLGCVFHTRCPKALPQCTVDSPELQARQTDGDARHVACHLISPITA